MELIDLGEMPLSNAFLSKEDLEKPEKKYPLRVLVCTNCWLVQTDDFAGREEIFNPDYAYFSSYSDTWLQHCKEYVESVVDRLGLSDTSFVVEVAANDGYLLQYFKARNIPCLGIEPTASTASAARAKEIEIVEGFFGEALARRLVAGGRSADLMIANNVLAHVPDIRDFVKGFSVLLKQHGVATFEFPHLCRMIESCQFDTIYHEHYSYLSLTALMPVLQESGLQVFDVERLVTHGGSLRLYVQPEEGRRQVKDAVSSLLDEETALGLQTHAYYVDFASRAEMARQALRHFLVKAQDAGERVGAYGAAAKGNTLMNYAGITTELLPWVVDRNPAKQGKFLPGSRIPIVEEKVILQERPSYLLLLPWNLRNELADQLDYVRAWGGRMVTAVPKLEEF